MLRPTKIFYYQICPCSMPCKIEFEAFGGSYEKSPSKYMKKKFFPTSKFAIINFFL